MQIADPNKRIAKIGLFGDPEAGWHFLSYTPPDIPAMQSQHDGLVKALMAAGIEVHHAEGVDKTRLKSVCARSVDHGDRWRHRLPYGCSHPPW